MQKTIHRAISLLLVFTLLGSVLPVCAVASQELPAVSELHINPIYCDPLVEAELEAVPDGPSPSPKPENPTRARSTVLAQAIHHATEHRAQIAGALAAHGIDALDLDELDVWAYGDAEGLGA
jgi:hypothetical protein